MSFWKVFVVTRPSLSIDSVRSKKSVVVDGSSMSQFNLHCLLRSSLKFSQVSFVVGFHMISISSIIRL